MESLKFAKTDGKDKAFVRMGSLWAVCGYGGISLYEEEIIKHRLFEMS